MKICIMWERRRTRYRSLSLSQLSAIPPAPNIMPSSSSPHSPPGRRRTGTTAGTLRTWTKIRIRMREFWNFLSVSHQTHAHSPAWSHPKRDSSIFFCHPKLSHSSSSPWLITLLKISQFHPPSAEPTSIRDNTTTATYLLRQPALTMIWSATMWYKL